jgi:GntR family transcriptional repressor for pyruvate dehydrogenase complex
VNNIDYSITKTNLYEQIADTLEHAIIRSIKDVEKLPSEQELSKRFNVSRTVIREALKVLKERGLIQSRNGEGSYMCKPNSDTVSSAIGRIIQMDNINNDNLHDTRLILETSVARLAARNISNEELEYLECIIKKMSDLSLPLDDRISLDADFHVTIAKAGGNELLRMFVEVMAILLNQYMVKGMSGTEGMKKTLRQHEKILESLKSRDPDKAEQSIRSHLVAARKNVGKYEVKAETAPDTTAMERAKEIP